MPVAIMPITLFLNFSRLFQCVDEPGWRDKHIAGRLLCEGHTGDSCSFLALMILLRYIEDKSRVLTHEDCCYW
ncbi:hypothetical protein Krac_10607 [Ktedonobacter racemifer DSM 44963]|uniref:Uncharacterized protein n=1 Tax=Ktedonobacter racemifer DSM 44963 TaxID=485913 RepID=D6TI23_KTERA|nr:hypothetical protein Krac_10607 [Ktedonobacter racemifer DSM 44963]